MELAVALLAFVRVARGEFGVDGLGQASEHALGNEALDELSDLLFVQADRRQFLPRVLVGEQLLEDSAYRGVHRRLVEPIGRARDLLDQRSQHVPPALADEMREPGALKRLLKSAVGERGSHVGHALRRADGRARRRDGRGRAAECLDEPREHTLCQSGSPGLGVVGRGTP